MRPRSMSGSARLAGQPPAQAPNAALPPVPSMPPPPVPASTNSSNAATKSKEVSTTSSKASLSEALAQAQVAVQLDMSQDVNGAISAYRTSVDLLQQVMARVQAGIAKDQARSQQQGHGELPADKLERVRRRQEAKEEENRRLKTIHDTYLERINILLETPQQEAPNEDSAADALGHDYERHPFAYADPPPTSHSRAPSTTTSPLDDFHNTPTLQQQQQQQQDDSGDEAQIIIAHPRRMSNTAPASVSRFSRDSMAAGDATLTMDTPRPRSGDHQFSRSSQQRYSNSSQTLINPSTQHGSIHQRRRQPSDASSSSFFFSSPPHTPGRHSRHSRSSSLYHRHSQSIEGLPTSSQSPFHTEPSTPTASSSHHSVTTDFSPSQQQSSSIATTSRSNNNINNNYKRDSRSPPPTSNHSISPPPPPPVEKESSGFSFSKSFANRPRSLSQTGRKDSIASTTSAAAAPQLPALPPSFHLTSSSSAASPSSASILDLDTPAAHHADSLAAQQQQPPLSSTSMSSATAPPYSPAGPAPSSTPIQSSFMLPPINRQLFLPVSQVRQPFQFLLRIKQSILHGDYLTHRLYAPKSIWAQAGIKLTSLESKQRMIEMLLIALDGVDRAGEPLLVPRAVDHPRYARASGERLAHELESFDHVIDHIENGLARKLSLSEGPGVKKGGMQGWLPKMARGLDKMANKSNDAPQGYVDGLHRLCEGAQLLDRHLALLQGDVQPTPYPDLAPATRNVLAARLHRQSEFFATVVCRWVLGDVAVLLDKHAKRAGAWSME